MEIKQKVSSKLQTASQFLYAVIFAGLTYEIIIDPGWLVGLDTRKIIITILFFLIGVGMIFRSVQIIKLHQEKNWQKIMALIVFLAALSFCAAVVYEISSGLI